MDAWIKGPSEEVLAEQQARVDLHVKIGLQYLEDLEKYDKK